MNKPVISAADHAFCAAMLPGVSRTFAISIEGLPDSLRDAVRVSYLLCRIVDSIEDAAGIAPAERAALFDCFDTALQDDALDACAFELLCHGTQLGGDSPEATLCSGAAAVFRVFRELPDRQRGAIRPYVYEMSKGMREYTARADAAGQLRLTDLAELEHYCYYVAGTVGKLLTALFEQQVPTLSDEARNAVRSRSVSFGLGLQMVNIVKDVAADFTRGDCYLPLSLAEQYGVSLESVLDPNHREAALAVVRAVCARAREHLERAEEYTQAWPLPEGEPMRLFCAVPLALALATLREVERGPDTLRPGKTPKVSRLTTIKVMAEAKVAASNANELTKMLTRYARA